MRLGYAYDVDPDIAIIAHAILSRNPHLPQGVFARNALIAVIGILVQSPVNIDKIKLGRPLPKLYRDAMSQMVAASRIGSPPEAFIETVVSDLRDALKRVSG